MTVTAVVDRMRSPSWEGLATAVLDPASMEQAGLRSDDLVLIDSGRGRPILARLRGPGPDEDSRAGTLQLDRHLRRALGVRLNQRVELTKARAPAELEELKLAPAIDLEGVTGLVAHLSETLSKARAPASLDSILSVRFPGSSGGTSYKVVGASPAEGWVGPGTRVQLGSPATQGKRYHETLFSDLGGLDDTIGRLRELIQLPMQFPYLYAEMGIQAPRGILLHGPPGTGKSHLVRALANEIDASLFYVNGPEVVGAVHGETEGNIRKIFAEAAQKAPSLILVDEVDAIAHRRGEGGSQAGDRMVAQLLTVLDGLERCDGVMVVATTNRLGSIDEAFLRSGRLGHEIFVGPPSESARQAILEIHTSDMPLSEEVRASLADVAAQAIGYVGADLVELCRQAGLRALRRRWTLDDHLAAFEMIDRDVEVTKEDFSSALAGTRPSAFRYLQARQPAVQWGDVLGLEAKTEIATLVDRIMRGPESGEGPAPKVRSIGVVISGESGSGKTHLAHALASRLRANLLTIEAASLFTRWVGESEARLKEAFAAAVQAKPALVLVEDLETLAPGHRAHEFMEAVDRVITQLHLELDQLAPGQGVAVVATTARPEAVDPSLSRPGRLGIRVALEPPTDAERAQLLGRAVGALDPSAVPPGELVTATKGWSRAHVVMLGDALEEAVARAQLLGDTSSTASSILEDPEAIGALVQNVRPVA